MIKEHGTLIGNRYQIFDKLGEGGMGAVYRAKDRLTEEVVALKCLTEPVDKLMFASRDSISRTDVALANEFRTLASLRHPHIINVLDYGFDRNRQPFFTMNLLERSQTIVEYCKNKFEEEKVRLLVEMLQALTYLHRRDILHRDLKPANVLVTNSGQVKVLDFGLSTTSDQAKGTAGTLAYMAPELIRGQPPSQTSDLYAVGMIAYEVFTGSYPFEATNPTLMMMRIIQAIPDFSVINNLSLEVVLMRLLMKDPEDRYPDADTVIMELHNAVGIAPPKENKAVRESFLQAAKFIGRENELAQLTNALHNTMQGQGSMWLVGGESGVGKTRLLDELRTHALVQGSLVLHGQAVEGGGLPYQLWREPMRRLVLSTELNDLEAGVIKAIVPDIGNLLERDVPDAPELTGQAGQQRLLLTIADVFKRQTTPILLLLEDLQWVAQYLEPLKTLNRIASDLRLLVVGNYRNDERPDLPNEIPGANLIRLERFSEKEVAALSHSMLGESGQKTDVLQLLNKETEGNVFFLVEVVRALAEQVGHLREVGRMTLPDQVFSGGIKQIIQRRLDKVPVQLQPLSKLAAVMGREIDPAVLSHIVEAKQVEDWLIACADASVLDIREDRWLFAHDKLREALLADLSAEERSVVHRQVAEAIELAYPGDDIYAVVLAHHWHEAGNDEKERHYAYIAGRRAFDSGTVPEARRFFERALEITREDDVLNYADLLNDLGQAVGYLADYLTATQHLEQSLSLSQSIGNKTMQAVALNRLSTIFIEQGQLHKATEYADRARKLHKETDYNPQSVHSLDNLARIAALSDDHLNAKQYFEEVLATHRAEQNLHDIARTLANLGGVVARIGEYESALQYLEEGLEVSRKIGSRKGITSNLINLSFVLIKRGEYDYDILRRYLEEAVTVTRETGDLASMALSMSYLAYSAMSHEEYASAQQYYEECLAIEGKIGHRHSVYTLLQLGDLNVLIGDYDAAEHYYQETLTRSKTINDHRSVAASLHGLGTLSMFREEHDTAQHYLKESLVEGRAINAQWEVAHTLSDLSHAAVIRGDVEGAWSYCRDALSEATASDEDAADVILHALAVVARIWVQQAVNERAAKLVGLLIADDRKFRLTQKRILDPVLDDLREKMSDDDLESALEHGSALDLETVVQELLEELGRLSSTQFKKTDF